MPQQAEWNFIFLIYADLRINSKDLHSDSEKVKLLKAVIAGLPVPAGSNLLLIVNEISLDDPSRREVHKDRFRCEQCLDGQFIQKYDSSEADEMDDKPVIIADYLNAIRHEFNAAKTALFTWDHGNIFGINRVTVLPGPPLAEKINKALDEFDISTGTNFYINPTLYRKFEPNEGPGLKEIFRNIKNASTWVKDFMGELANKEGLTDNEPVADMLTNTMLAQALEMGGFNSDRKLDLICMMNCCMQNLHTQYTLHENVKNMVAPQTWIYFPGYDYRTIFTNLNTASMDGEGLAQMIVSTARLDAQKPDPLVDRAAAQGIFAVRLDKIGEIAQLIKEHIQFEANAMTADRRHKFFLSGLLHFPYRAYEQTEIIDYRLIDLYHLCYFRTRYSRKPFAAAQLKLNELADQLLNDSKIDEFIGREVFQVGDREISGLCMSLPIKRTYENQAQIFIGTYFKTGKYQCKLINFLGLNTLIEEVYAS